MSKNLKCLNRYARVLGGARNGGGLDDCSAGQHSSKVLSKDRTWHPREWKGCKEGRAFPYARARRFSSDGQQEDLDISTTVMSPVPSVLSQRRQPPEAGVPFSAWRVLQTDDVIRFRAEGVAFDEKEKCCLADLSAPRATVKLVCSVTAILDSRSGISTVSESVAAKRQAAVPGV